MQNIASLGGTGLQFGPGSLILYAEHMSDLSVLPAETIVEHRPDGTVYARSPFNLGAYPRRITERLEHWAAVTPDRVFLARRDRTGGWLPLTYRDTLTRVRVLSQALLNRQLAADRPLVILSGNSIEHALLALAAMYCGVPYAPLAPGYSLRAREYTTLRSLWSSLRPGLVFAAEGALFERALTAVAEGVEVVTCDPPGTLRTTLFGELEATPVRAAVDDAHAAVGPSTVAKILYTSGSTGRPKGVINTHRMLCANQQMLLTVLPFLGEDPPILCDWLPWNHTFGGNHNFGIVLFNGGTLYIDDGTPTAAGFETTIANLREVATTAYFNVPKGYDLLVPRLAAEPDLRGHFFSRLRMLFCAAASLRQSVADDLYRLAGDAAEARIPLVTGLGATESAPFALCAGNAEFTGGRIGVPVPGVELKLAPVGDRMEGRLRGPNITPGYWRDDALTATAFDEEGFYKLGDALRFFDPHDPSQGFAFEGRLSDDFKLSTGTWVRVGPLRAKLLAHFGELVQEVVLTGHDRDFVGALIFPDIDACRATCGSGARDRPVREMLDSIPLRQRFSDRLAAFAVVNPGSSLAVVRAVLLDVPPSMDAHETTEKGSVNQRAVLAHRAAIVDQIYDDGSSPLVIDITSARGPRAVREAHITQ
jgi:feruloyl-CoA synthase